VTVLKFRCALAKTCHGKVKDRSQHPPYKTGPFTALNVHTSVNQPRAANPSRAPFLDLFIAVYGFESPGCFPSGCFPSHVFALLEIVIGLLALGQAVHGRLADFLVHNFVACSLAFLEIIILFLDIGLALRQRLAELDSSRLILAGRFQCISVCCHPGASVGYRWFEPVTGLA